MSRVACLARQVSVGLRQIVDGALHFKVLLRIGLSCAAACLVSIHLTFLLVI
jgi:hypothetical protein